MENATFCIWHLFDTTNVIRRLNSRNGNTLMQCNNIYFVRSFNFDHQLLNDSLYNLQTCCKIKNVIFIIFHSWQIDHLNNGKF